MPLQSMIFTKNPYLMWSKRFSNSLNRDNKHFCELINQNFPLIRFITCRKNCFREIVFGLIFLKLIFRNLEGRTSSSCPTIHRQKNCLLKFKLGIDDWFRKLRARLLWYSLQVLPTSLKLLLFSWLTFRFPVLKTTPRPIHPQNLQQRATVRKYYTNIRMPLNLRIKFIFSLFFQNINLQVFFIWNTYTV